MKKVLLSAFACMMLVTASYATNGVGNKETVTPDTTIEDATLFFGCGGSYEVRDKHGKVLDYGGFASTTAQTAADCFKQFADFISTVEAKYPEAEVIASVSWGEDE